MKCSELGGMCDEELYAENWSEMVEQISGHVMRYHPNAARRMAQMHEKDPEQWGRIYKTRWHMAPAV
jgi:predicted small metal-binding protein